MKTTAEVYHPITEPLPDGLLLHKDGGLSTKSDVPVSTYLSERLTLQKPHVVFPVPICLLLRDDAERLRENTVAYVKLRAERELTRAMLVRCHEHLGAEIARKVLNESAEDGTQALSKAVAALLDATT